MIVKFYKQQIIVRSYNNNNNSNKRYTLHSNYFKRKFYGSKDLRISKKIAIVSQVIINLRLKILIVNCYFFEELNNFKIKHFSLKYFEIRKVRHRKLHVLINLFLVTKFHATKYRHTNFRYKRKTMIITRPEYNQTLSSQFTYKHTHKLRRNLTPYSPAFYLQYSYKQKLVKNLTLYYKFLFKLNFRL